LRNLGGSGTSAVAVKCVESTWNTKGVGSYLGVF